MIKHIFLGVFIELPKSFDTVNHQTWLTKLDHYEINGKSLSWCQCYFTNRKQFTEYENNEYVNGDTNDNDNNKNCNFTKN